MANKQEILYNLRLLRDTYDNFFNETPEEIQKLFDDYYDTYVSIDIIKEFINSHTPEYHEIKKLDYANNN
jgi:hypothetical protein